MPAAKTFDELIAWQRCEQLRQFVSHVTSRPPAIRDRDFCWQIRRASRSATDNIAEGFGRYYPKEFHRYVQIARGEINETNLALHAVRTTAGLQRYLKSCIPDHKKPRRP